MRTADTEIYDVRLYGEGPLVAIGISGQEITYIGERQGCAVSINGYGLAAVPAWIDGHVHMRHCGSDFCREDWIHGSRAALAGGIATVLDMGNHPGKEAIVTAEAFARKVQILIQYKPCLTHRLWFMATPGGIGEFKLLLRQPLLASWLAGIKICMEETTGGIIVDNFVDQLEWCTVAAETGTLIAAHVGNQAMIQANRRRYTRPTIADHCVIRDTEVEVSGGAQFLEALRKTGARGEIKHVSTPELIEETQAARLQGVDVSLEMCPHHWLLTDEQLRGEQAAYFKMNPPLRTVDQVSCMPGYLADGTITTIATDHAPQTIKEKERPEYDNVPSGIPGVQEMMPLAMRLVRDGTLTLSRLIDLAARNPAKLYGLTSKGALEPGKDADIVLLDPNEEGTFQADMVLSKCGWTAYDGQRVCGIPRFVMARGKILIDHLPVD